MVDDGLVLIDVLGLRVLIRLLFDWEKIRR